MNRSKWLALSAVLLIVAGVTWYIASPAYTLTQIKAAAESKDADALAGYIDFSALREDLKADLLGQMMAEAHNDNAPFSGLAMAIGPAMVNSMVDGFVTPAGMKAMFASRQASTAAPKRPAAGAFELKDKPVIRRRGLSEFLVTSEDEPGSGMVSSVVVLAGSSAASSYHPLIHKRSVCSGAAGNQVEDFPSPNIADTHRRCSPSFAARLHLMRERLRVQV